MDIERLRDRIRNDAKGLRFDLEVTLCDEVDRVSEFKKWFDIVNTYDSNRAGTRPAPTAAPPSVA